MLLSGVTLAPPETGCLGVGRHLSPDCGETGSSPGFTGSPLVSMPRARDSGDPGSTSHYGGPDAAFRWLNGVGIAIIKDFGADPHGLLTRCVRFAPASRPANGNTRYRPARYGFDRAGLAPAGLQQEVSPPHHGSPSSALSQRDQPLRYLHDCSDCFRPEQKLPGGSLTHWKTPPLHGAHPTKTYSDLGFMSYLY